jgi:hypothetical protein
MAISINGSTGIITGVAVGGLPNGIVDTDMLANNAVTPAKSSGFQRRISTSLTLPTNTGEVTHNVTTGVKKIEIILSDVSSNSNSQLHIQIGDSGGIETSNYNHAMGFHRTGTSGQEASVSNSTGAFASYGLDSASYHIFGVWILNNPHSNTWVSDFTVWGSAASNHQFYGTGYKTLSDTLTQFKFYVGGGNFDAGYLTIIETMGDD